MLSPRANRAFKLSSAAMTLAREIVSLPGAVGDEGSAWCQDAANALKALTWLQPDDGGPHVRVDVWLNDKKILSTSWRIDTLSIDVIMLRSGTWQDDLLALAAQHGVPDSTRVH